MNLVPLDDPRRAAYLERRSPAVAPAVACGHTPWCQRTDAPVRQADPSAAGDRVAEQAGATWCEACSDPGAAVLRWLASGPATVARIARGLGMHRPDVRDVVHRLHQRGKVERVGYVEGRGPQRQVVTMAVWRAP